MAIRPISVLIFASFLSLTSASGGESASPSIVAPAAEETRVDLRILLAQATRNGALPRIASCPARPTKVLRPAATQCGFTDKSEPRFGVFQCGLKLDANRTACEEQCQFIECRNP
jgi:hypothetical protein